MTLDPHKLRAEWLTMALVMIATVILFAYCGWRLAILDDVVKRKEVEFHLIWTVQEELRNNQREMLSRQAEMLRILGPNDHQSRQKAEVQGK